MKKPLTILLFAFLCIIMLSCSGQTTTTTTFPDPAKDITNRVNEVVCTLVTIGTYIASGVASLAIIFAGFKYVTSGDSPEARNSAKNMIIYAFTGLAIALLACPLIDYLVTGTQITPFEESCNCLVFTGNSSNNTGGNDGAGGGGGSSLKPNGQTCNQNNQCSSSSCKSGICCFSDGCIIMGQCRSAASCGPANNQMYDEDAARVISETVQANNMGPDETRTLISCYYDPTGDGCSDYDTLLEAAKFQITGNLANASSSKNKDTCSECSDGTACGQADSDGSICRCSLVQQDKKYSFCYLIKDYECDECSDGTGCGKINKNNMACECRNKDSSGKYELCFLKVVPTTTLA